MAHGPVLSFRDLHAWQVAMDLTLAVYGIAKRLPGDERFGLCGQMRRAAVSVPANIAEGHSSGSHGRCINHLAIAQGSLGELETELEIARRLAYISQSEYADAEQLFRRTGQLLHGLSNSVKRRRRALLAVSSGLGLLAWGSLFFGLGHDLFVLVLGY